MVFDRDLITFQKSVMDSKMELTAQIDTGQQFLPQVTLSKQLLIFISTICTKLRVNRLWVDITLYKTACALTAWEVQIMAENRDVKQATKWVLGHFCC